MTTSSSSSSSSSTSSSSSSSSSSCLLPPSSSYSSSPNYFLSSSSSASFSSSKSKKQRFVVATYALPLPSSSSSSSSLYSSFSLSRIETKNAMATSAASTAADYYGPSLSSCPLPSSNSKKRRQSLAAGVVGSSPSPPTSLLEKYAQPRCSLANSLSQPSSTLVPISVLLDRVCSPADAATVVPCYLDCDIETWNVFQGPSSFQDTGHALMYAQEGLSWQFPSASLDEVCRLCERIVMKNNENGKEVLNLEGDARMASWSLNLKHHSSECRTEISRDNAALIMALLNSVDANIGAVVYGLPFYSSGPLRLVVVKDQTSSRSKSGDQGGGAGNQEGNGGAAANGGGQGNEEVQQLADKELLSEGIKIIFEDPVVGARIIRTLAREDQADWPTFCMNVRRVRCDDAQGPPPGVDPGFNLWPGCEVRMTVRLRGGHYADFTPLRLSELLNNNRMYWANVKMGMSAVRLIHHA
ncbi:hypothetical protein Tsubulata_044204 [Turnera subulata]|uniref:Uncharacterized protein n=1 Tax=Turnera subulata TaxID=218843 RepID=A0A9Q0FIS9_9ROSI|nr:hypothetical protein Tsubulata_044204 [Turnera subulata]